MGVVYVNKPPHPRCFSYQGETKDLQAKAVHEGDAKELGEAVHGGQSTAHCNAKSRLADWNSRLLRESGNGGAVR